MKKLEAMISEVSKWREFHHEQGKRGVKASQIEAAACAIRQRALLDAKQAVIDGP